LRWINAEETEGAERYLEVNGLLVPGGFGNRGVDGKIWQFNMPAIARYRFGLVPGMQCSVIEWARHLRERMPIVPSLPQWQTSSNQPCQNSKMLSILADDAPRAVSLSALPNTLAFKLYQEEVVYERHRHRYEFNNAYRNLF